MLSEIQNLYNVWIDNRTINTSDRHQISFDELTNSIISTGPFYFYIIDFFDMSLSQISPSVNDIQGFNPETLSFDHILNSIHPEDLDFVIKAEAFLTHFFFKKLSPEKLLHYKLSYNFRMLLQNGQYVLFNHQSLMLTMDEQGGYGKSLNIHTRIDHLSSVNTHKVSLIGLNGEPSFINVNIDTSTDEICFFSKRELDIIKLIGNGLNNSEIAANLFISPLTVKTHRNNILVKSASKNTAQLIKKCIHLGII